MRLLIDANLPRSLVARMETLGHEVEFARDIGMAAASDDEIARRAQSRNAVIVTRDLDFSDIRRYPPNLFAGIVVLRLPENSIATEIVDIVARFLGDPIFVAHLPRRLAIVESNRVRFRPAVVLSS